MKHNRIFFQLAISFTILLNEPERVFGCTCYRVTPCEAFHQAKVVFVGKVVSGSEDLTQDIKEAYGRYTNIDESQAYYAGKVKFEVEEVFKGKNTSEIEIEVISAKGTSCGPRALKSGASYLIYGYESNGNLAVGPCDFVIQRKPQKYKGNEEKTTNSYIPRSQRLFDQEFHLETIRFIPEKGGRVEINVGINLEFLADYYPVAGVLIRFKGKAGNITKVVTDEEGTATIKNMVPGIYRFSAVWPKKFMGYLFRPIESQNGVIEIKEKSCNGLSWNAFDR